MAETEKVNGEGGGVRQLIREDRRVVSGLEEAAVQVGQPGALSCQLRYRVGQPLGIVQPSCQQDMETA